MKKSRAFTPNSAKAENADNRKIVLWYKHTIEELEAILLDQPLSYEDKKHIIGTIEIFKRLKKSYE